MILIAGLALALALVALVGARSERASELIVRQLAGERDPRIVSSAADILQGRGMHIAAETLRARARQLGETTATASGEPLALLPSPFNDVPPAAWTRFVRAMASEAPNARTAEGKLGLFGTSLQWLAEWGCVERPRRMPDGRLDAAWIAPTSEARFLSNPRLQYRIFVANVRALRPLIERRFGARGVRIGRRHATSSGLLAVGQRLGMTGLGQWVAVDHERAQWPLVWRLFESCNGLF